MSISSKGIVHFISFHTAFCRVNGFDVHLAGLYEELWKWTASVQHHFFHTMSAASPDFSFDPWPIENTSEDDCFLIKFRRKSVKPLINLTLEL